MIGFRSQKRSSEARLTRRPGRSSSSRPAQSASASSWALAQGRRLGARLRDLSERLKTAEFDAEAARGAVDAFDGAVLAISGDEVTLVSGAEVLAACAKLFASRSGPRSVLETLGRADP